jgi:hypothetical protein
MRGSESSLTVDGERWTHVKTKGVGGVPIVKSEARAAEGPWSGDKTVFTPPEARRKGVWVYAAKAHPEIVTPDGWVAITYNTNFVGDFAALVSDTSVYYPRFVRCPQ